MQENVLLQMTGITKRFPGTIALNRVDLTVRKQSVHALIGENGAGKSTLMKVLIGLYKPDEGTITMNGKPLQLRSVNDSIQNGISMIQQELSSIPDMTVAQNIFLGKEHTGFATWVDDAYMNVETQKLMKRLNIHIDSNMRMGNLSVANMQMIEIAKAISYNSDLIIMDEPTSALTEREVAHLYEIIEMLKSEGRSIIYISHKMDEIFKVCDELTVLRDGEYIGADRIANLDKDHLITMMVGRELTALYSKDQNVHIRDEVALEVKGLSIEGKIHDAGFRVRKGEILGISGLLGSGRTEMIEGIFGLRKLTGGEILIHGKPVKIRYSEDAIKWKMGLVTEDRKLTGMFAPLNIRDNMGLAGLAQYNKGGVVDDQALLRDCEKLIRDLRIKTIGPGQIINDLSGGNQQKVLIARWLLLSPDILFLDEPTRGIDVHSKSEIYRIMNELAKQGTAIVMISSEMPELLSMSDNILVMCEGRVTGQLSIAEATQNKLLMMAMGESGDAVNSVRQE